MRNTRFWAGFLALATSLALGAGTAQGEVVVNPGDIVSGSAQGTLTAIDVPNIGTPVTKPSGPNWPENADDGFRFLNGNFNFRTQTSPWEPNGTILSDARSYSVSAGRQNLTSPDASWTFNLPDGALIHAVYATWRYQGNNGRRLLWGYTEGGGSDSISIHQNSSNPVGNLVLRWTDSGSVGRNANFHRIFSGPIIVDGGNGFTVLAAENWNEGWVDAVVVDFTADPPNLDPICKDIADRTISCGDLRVDGTAIDPENKPLTYAWSGDCVTFSPNVSSPVVEITPTGDACGSSCVISLTVTDEEGATCSDSFTLTLDDTTPPALFNIPEDITVQCDLPEPTVYAVDHSCVDGQGGSFVTDNHIITGSAQGALLAVDVPNLGASASPVLGPDHPEAADEGFRLLNGRYNFRTQSSQWEPDGTLLSEARSYSVSSGRQNLTSPDASWTFNIPDGSTIHAVYATWTYQGNNGRRLLWGYTEGANSGSISIQQNSGNPINDLVLRWTDSVGGTHDGNFQKIFASPITVGGGDGFTLKAAENWNEGWVDAVVIDYTPPSGNMTVTVTDEPVGGDILLIRRTFTATDACGNSVQASQLITRVSCNEPPVCDGAAIADQTANDNCQAVIDESMVTGIYDPDEGDEWEITALSPTTLELGPNDVTVTAKDTAGESCTHTFTVNVADVTPPTITLPENPVELECDEDPANVAGPTVVDNCDDAAVEMCDSLWLNEVHYDNSGTDANEFIEIAGVAGTDLTGVEVVLYDGSSGLAYDTQILSGTMPNQRCGYGAVAVTYPVNGIQNGTPDGFALAICNGDKVTFLSYEGGGSGQPFMALDGPAVGLTSTVLGVNETPSAVGNSLQLEDSGVGTMVTTPAGTFYWANDAGNPASPGMLNDPQTIDPCPKGITRVSFSESVVNTGCGSSKTIERVYTAIDSSGNVATATQTINVVDTQPPVITCPADVELPCGSPTNPDATGEATAQDACSPQPELVAITEFIADPFVSDTTDEWVEIFNYGAGPVNLLNWVLADEGSNASTLPAYTLESGEFAILVKPSRKERFEDLWLSGAANDAVLEVDASFAIGNGADELILRDSGGEVKWSLAYGNDETRGRATYLTGDDLSINAYGTEADPGVVRAGTDDVGVLGYEKNNATTDAAAYSVVGGDVGSPLAGPYLVILDGDGPGIPGEGSVTITFEDETEPGCSPDTSSITRTWTAVDACGNASSCDQLIEVVDNTPPEITCPAPVVVDCLNVVPSSDSQLGDVMALDNCEGDVSVFFESDASNNGAGCLDNPLVITRTFTAIDSCGNAASCSTTITVIDDMAPTFDDQVEAIVDVDCSGAQPEPGSGASGGAADSGSGGLACDDPLPTSVPPAPTLTASDNCDTDVDMVFSELQEGDCPGTITRAWTATDDCGNDVVQVQVVVLRKACVQDAKYWAANPDAWLTPEGPVTAADLGGVEPEDALALMNQKSKGDATIKLAIELIAAMLNVAQGADDTCANVLIAQAADYLGVVPVGSDPSGDLKKASKSIEKALKAFNKGECCAPVCPDEGSGSGATASGSGGSGGSPGCDDPTLDTDSDGLPDCEDNCPTIGNSGQSDIDQDGVGDFCDPDFGV